MATPLTPAHLPPHVIKAVIGYVIEAPDDFEDLIAEYVTDSAFKPLLHVCCSWREVAMPMMFAGCNASISDHVSFTYRPVGSNPCIIQQVDSHYNQHVRYMFLKLDYASIATGAALLTNLTALRCRWDANHTTTARLIHASTQTLLHLSICLHTAAGLELLVFNSHRQEPVVFPYLTKLLLSQRPDVSIKPLLPIDQVAPFPRLQRLQLSVKYPFSDDLPFRGNASTLDPLNTNLQSLHIYDFEANSVNMMAASVLLLADQCPHLTMVKFPKDREDCALNVLLRLNHSR
ncbi:hypothetical protein LPJ63_001409 [Coemansia sp. RSA 2711]|nr:hypothetical protein LPJ63_001409 [Coemansia sp. RSA 2711]